MNKLKLVQDKDLACCYHVNVPANRYNTTDCVDLDFISTSPFIGDEGKILIDIDKLANILHDVFEYGVANSQVIAHNRNKQKLLQAKATAKRLKLRNQHRATTCSGCKNNYYNFGRESNGWDVAVAEDYSCWYIEDIKRNKCKMYR